VQAGSGWSLVGAKSMVPAGDQADAFLVPAMANGKMALFIVERAASGVTTRGYGTQDGSARR
jgi:alkylation response protein AidB-like acyl-CoA dehydrogenase